MSALRDQFEGREFDWFAVDAEGKVGHFSSAGFGLVPVRILERFAEVELLPEELLRLPETCAASGHLPGKIADWIEMANRGLYSFDWQHSSGPYRLAAMPEKPIHVSSLPLHLQAGMAIVKFPHVRFSETIEFRPEQECACE